MLSTTAGPSRRRFAPPQDEAAVRLEARAWAGRPGREACPRAADPGARPWRVMSLGSEDLLEETLDRHLVFAVGAFFGGVGRIGKAVLGAAVDFQLPVHL